MSHPQRRPAQGPSGAGTPDPVLITDAARSYEEDLATRKRRYALMMGMRLPCMVLAAVFYQTPWVAVTLLVLSIPLPWMAVLVANDRLPRKREEVNRFQGDRVPLEDRAQPVTDGRPAIAARAAGPVVDGSVVDGSVLDDGSSDDGLRHGSGRPDARRAG